MHLSNSRERPLARLPSGELVRSAHGGYQDPQLSQHGGPSSQHGGGSPLHRTPTTSTHKSIPITPPRIVGTYYSRSGSGGSSRDSSRHDNNLSPQSSLHGRNRYLTYPPSRYLTYPPSSCRTSLLLLPFYIIYVPLKHHIAFNR